MIVCTKALDAISARAFGKKNVAISSVEKMISQFQIDPAVSGTNIEAFLIADTDVRNKSVKQKFLTAAATKHPDINIIYIVRSARADVEAVNGINLVLKKPSPETLQTSVFEIVENITKKADVISSAEAVPVSIEPFKAPGLIKNQEVAVNEVGQPIDPQETIETEKVLEKEVKSIISLEKEKLPISEEDLTIPPPIVEELPSVNKSELIDRVKSCDTVCDIAVLSKEISATALIKDIVKSNAQYVNIEDRLKAIRERMLTVYSDISIHSEEEKLDKIKALVYDKDRYMSESNTIIEQRIVELICTIIDKTKECLNKRLAELDLAIQRINSSVGDKVEYARIAGITDERANLILELQTLDKEVRDIFTNAQGTATDITAIIADKSAAITDSPLLNARMRWYGESVVSDKSLDVIINILTTAERTSDEFKEAARSLVTIQKKLNKLIDLDNEKLAAYAQVVEYLRANNVEDNVIKNSLIKKSLRVYVANEGSGRTCIPYMLSKLKSRENYNTLYVDITGTNKLADYGESFYTLEEWMTYRHEKDFVGVVGTISENVDAIQRFMSALVKAADYYRVINVVISPEQIEVFKNIAPDVLVVNYLVDTRKKNLEFFRDFIKNTRYANVAQRVIVNKCDVPLRPILDVLDVVESADVHVAKIPNIPAITECGLNGVQPCELQSVKEALREVRKVC